MLTFKRILNRCGAVCGLALLLFCHSAIVEAASGEEATQRLNDVVMTYGYSKDASDLKIINSMLKSGVKPDIHTLWYAALYKHPALLERLLKYPVNVE